jgi:hypothetical protein
MRGCQQLNASVQLGLRHRLSKTETCEYLPGWTWIGALSAAGISAFEAADEARARESMSGLLCPLHVPGSAVDDQDRSDSGFAIGESDFVSATVVAEDDLV